MGIDGTAYSSLKEFWIIAVSSVPCRHSDADGILLFEEMLFLKNPPPQLCVICVFIHASLTNFSQWLYVVFIFELYLLADISTSVIFGDAFWKKYKLKVLTSFFWSFQP